MKPAGHRALILFAVAAFLLYAAGVLTLRQDRLPGWSLEAAGAIPAAASYLVYGAPFGAVEHEVEAKFHYPDGLSVQDVLALAVAKSMPSGVVDRTTIDGVGAGIVVFAIVAMATFGLNLFSLVLLYLLMTGISVVAFALRYCDRRLIVVPLYFLVVTVLLLTPLGTSPVAVDQVPVGGQRYFVLATVLPALHIFFEITDRSPPTGLKRQIANALLLFIQALLLLAALLVRSSTGYLVMALFAVWVFRLYRERGRTAQLRALLRKTAILACACGIFAVAVVTALPAYVQSGRLFGTIWHRAFATLAVHPDWPFGDLAKVYDCTKYLPDGLGQLGADGDAQCVWWAYPPNAKRSFYDVARGTYGGEYEKAVRQAYFYVLAHYPRQVLETYVVYKPRYIADVVAAAWRYPFALARAPAPKALFVVTAAQLLVFVGFVVLVAAADRAIIDRQLAIFAIFLGLSFAPLFFAVAYPPTALDMIFMMYACVVLAMLWMLQLLRNAITSGAPPRPAKH